MKEHNLLRKYLKVQFNDKVYDGGMKQTKRYVDRSYGIIGRSMNNSLEQ